MDNYRPQHDRAPAYRGSRYEDEDHPPRRGAGGTYRDYDRGSHHQQSSRGRYRSRSPVRRLDYGDDRDRSDGQVEYSRYDEYDESEDLSFLQHERASRRAYGGRERYEEPYYEPEPLIDPPYNGDYDVSLDGKPMRLLLVRNLKESVTEELFAKGLEKLNISDESPNGAAKGSLRRIMIIRNGETDRSMSFGFAEYHKLDDAAAALAKAKELGERCTIASRLVTIGYPHLATFPRADFGADERRHKFTVIMPSTGEKHKYYDERYYPSELMINELSPHDPSTESIQPAAGSEDAKDKSKKRKAPAQAVATPAFLQHWQNKATELRTEEERAEAEKAQEKAERLNRAPVTGVNAIAPPPAPVYEQTFVVDNQKLKCCYLCGASFQTTDGLQRHLKDSPKHVENLQSEEATKRAHGRLKKANLTLDDTIKLLSPRSATASADAAEAAATDYRDRAAERRRVEALSGDKSGGLDAPKISLKLGKGNRQPSPAESEPPKYGKGLNLLQKAGWSTGQGLGVDGSGLAAPVEQSLYAAGVGLGHDSSKKGDAVEEAARMTKGDDRGGFLEKTKEVARMRYEKMG